MYHLGIFTPQSSDSFSILSQWHTIPWIKKTGTKKGFIQPCSISVIDSIQNNLSLKHFVIWHRYSFYPVEHLLSGKETFSHTYSPRCAVTEYIWVRQGGNMGWCQKEGSSLKKLNWKSMLDKDWGAILHLWFSRAVRAFPMNWCS